MNEQIFELRITSISNKHFVVQDISIFLKVLHKSNNIWALRQNSSSIDIQKINRCKCLVKDAGIHRTLTLCSTNDLWLGFSAVQSILLDCWTM